VRFLISIVTIRAFDNLSETFCRTQKKLLMEMPLVINLVSSFMLCGVIWLVQLVHYPFFHRAERDRFPEHMGFHKLRISVIVMPLMVAELATSLWLSLSAADFILLHRAGLGIVILIWLATFFVSVPLHEKISAEYDEATIQKLVATNLVRTVLWTLKAILGIVILMRI
jgi:hypothetical protein